MVKPMHMKFMSTISGRFQISNNAGTVYLFTILFCIGFISCTSSKETLSQQAPEPSSGVMAGQPESTPDSPEPGLLFYLSGEKEFEADYAAGGQTLPNYLRDVRIIEDGPFGKAIQADDSQLLSYWSPGNIYAQRGTLSFFWRSRYAVGPTEFPVFRVGYADHSSWDMIWLRIDYNGSGFDAFVTDVGLTQTRISWHMDEFPGPDEWIHIAFSWDETDGIRLYVNGELAKHQTVTGMVYDTGLDQFGPHSRIISPYQVQSRYNFKRGGDLAELRIYDRMLSDENVAELARGETPQTVPDSDRDLTERRWRDAWWTRHGWNLPNEAPPVLTSSHTSVRKVPVRDAIDIKRWYWKANDGIRETSWPGVYNMSRLPGRYDYFVLPDWDAYSVSGQTIRFKLPDNEPWNHVEMWGKAWGQLTHESDHPYDDTFAVRSQRQVKSYHRLDEPKNGGTIRFDNALIEEPINTFMVYNVEEGRAPEGRDSETFVLTQAPRTLENRALNEIALFVKGRYPADERSMMVGVPQGESSPGAPQEKPAHAQPVIHIAIPYSENSDSGLIGVEIEIPSLQVSPTHGDVFPMNLRIKDPLWLMRDLADFSFSIKPGNAHTLYIDTRDRMLPEGRALYLTLAGAGADLTPELLQGTTIRLIYSSKEDVLTEHIEDRFTQMKDLHAHNVEESPRSPRLNSYNRFYADLHDILKYDPDHWLTKTYWYWASRDQSSRPDYEISEAPDGIPEWAHLQVEYLRHLERVVMHFIDERQISNGEFGGGLSDDGDLTNMFVGTAFVGIHPERILESLLLHMTAYYDQDRDPYDAALKQRSLPLFTNGLATIHTDYLHALEEGIQVVGQLQHVDHGNPLHFNRGMETAKRLLEDIVQENPQGHKLFRSMYYGGTEISKEDPWQWSDPWGYHMLHTLYFIARYNGNPDLRNLVIDMADAILAHADDEGNVYTRIHFETGDVRGSSGIQGTWPVFLAAYQFSGDEKYLELVSDRVQKERDFDPERLVERYREEITELGVREYIHIDGSIWIDRIHSNQDAIQQDRLGGVAMRRINHMYPQNYVRWKIQEPGNFESLAIFLPRANRERIVVIAFNLDQEVRHADMGLEDIIPGQWKIRQGLDTTGDQQIDRYSSEEIVDLQRDDIVNFQFEPREHTIIQMELVEPAAKGYWERADLAIGRDDVNVSGDRVTVRVHSLGAIDTPETVLELRDQNGGLISRVNVPSLKAPLDLVPKWTDIRIDVPEGIDLTHGSVTVDPENSIQQISRSNTSVKW